MSHVLTPIQSVQIENFRGIRKADLRLHPEVTVFFGANASGKTSVLEAIAVGLGAINSRTPKATGRDFAKTGDIRVPWKNRPEVDEKEGIERPFSRITVEASHGLRWDVTKLRSRQDRPSAPKPVGTKALREALDPLVLQALDAQADEVTNPIPLVAAYGTERAVVDVPLRERGFEREFHRLGGLDQSLRATTRFKSVFEWFRIAEDEERRQRIERKDLDYVSPTLEWVRMAVERAALRCRNPRVETKPIRMLVDFVHGEGETETLDINSLSDGYRTHFALVVDVARRMVQLNPSPDLEDPVRGTRSEAVILVDEVDLHLHPAWQATVVQGLRRAFPNAQLVLTTHSEQVLGSVDADCVRKLVWQDGEIRITDVPFAQGATGGRILVELMDVDERPPGPVTDSLKSYLRLVERGDGETEDAHRLRSELDEEIPGDPLLHRADLEMQKSRWLSRRDEA